jgi:Pentapeptide repeats (8 copies)
VGRRKISLAVITFAVSITILTALDIGPLPSWLFHFEYAAAMHLSSFQKFQLEQAIRTTVLQAIAGLLLISGAIATWRQVVTASQTLALNVSTKAIDVFARAVENLASTSSVTRIGGIYTLDRIASNQPQELVQVQALLTAFVRSKPDNPLNDIGSDVQVAINVLVTGRYPELNLDDARLRGASLRHANFKSASLRRVILNHAILVEADLKGACLTGADLRDADLTSADLRSSDLRDADLTGTILDGIQSDTKTQWPSSRSQP